MCDSENQIQTSLSLGSILEEMKKMNATNASLLLLIEEQNALIKKQGDILARVAESTSNSSSILASVTSKSGYATHMIRVYQP